MTLDIFVILMNLWNAIYFTKLFYIAFDKGDKVIGIFCLVVIIFSLFLVAVNVDDFIVALKALP